ncbi:MAG TPA: DUF4394 domain-containing protein [Isosphaeraceae bacterium]
MSFPLWHKRQKPTFVSARRARHRNRVLREIRPLERCEDRTLLTTIYGTTSIGGVENLIRFDSATPGTLDLGPTPIANLQGGGGETIIGIDFRPADGQLYAVTNAAGTGRLYTINPATAAATLRATLTAAAGDPFAGLVGTSFGVDFNPVPDRLRVVSDADQNLRINPNNGQVITDSPLNPGNPNVVGSAYTNDFFGATTTTLFGIDTGTDSLVRQGGIGVPPGTPSPNGGLITTVGSLNLAGDVQGPVGFDVQALPGPGNAAFAALSTNGTSSALYTINIDLASPTVGTATPLGNIGGTQTLVRSLAVLPGPSDVAPRAFGVDTSNNLVRLNAGTPATPVSTTPITGLQGGAGEAVIGLDFRPATNQLYAVSNEAGTGRLYTIDPVTAAVTFRATLTADPTDASNPFTALNGTSFGVDFNPTVDRLRVVSDADQNLRINVDAGLVITDDPLNPGTPNVVGSAYITNVNGATTTTLYGIDSGTDALVIQNPPNIGVLNQVGTGLGVGDIGNAVGFDVRTVGGTNRALASLVVGGVSSLYTINLTAGTATLLGTIGGNPLVGLTIAPEGFSNTTLVGNTATFTGGPGADTIVFDQSGGLLRHNRFSAGDSGFTSDFDFDPNLPGDQTLSATNPALTIIVNTAGADDRVTIGSPSAPASGLAASFQINGQGGGDSLTIDDTADATGRPITINGTSGTITGLGGTITLGTLERVTLNAGTGNDTINVQGTSAAATSINAGGGNDTVAFGVDATLSGGFVDGGTGFNTLDYSASTSAVTVDLSAAQAQTLFLATLTASQEPGPLSNSPATGQLVGLLNAAQTALTFNVTYQGLTGSPISGTHFHNQAIGVNGPIVRGLFPSEQNGLVTPSGTFAGTWSASDPILTPPDPAAPGASVRPLTAPSPVTPGSTLVQELLAGRIYFNIHTLPNFPTGEIRGQLFAQGTVNAAPGTAGVRGFANVTGGSGNDTLTGDANVNILRGGIGNDTIVGGQGGDQLFGDDGNDTIIWNNGDGSDFMEGGDDDDTVQVNGSPTGGDQFLIRRNSADPNRLRFDRTNLGLFNLDIGTTEALDFNTLGGDDTLTVDFANGNPIPQGINNGPGIDFDGGAVAGGGTPTIDLLVLQSTAGTFFAGDQFYDAIGPGEGNLFLDDTFLTFANLLVVNDTVPATNVPFTAPAFSTAINVFDGPATGNVQVAQINDGGAGTFVPINFANKVNVAINSDFDAQAILLNNPTAPTGLSTLTVNANVAADQVTVVATPPGVAITVNTLDGDDIHSVTGAGVPIGTTLSLDGGPGIDTLNFDAGGAAVTVVPGLLRGVTIRRAGSGSVDFVNFEQVNVFNVAPPPTVIVAPAPAVAAVEGRPLVDVVVAQFTADPTAAITQFDVTINWGDGTLASAGRVARDAVNPGLYNVAGSHTYDSPGTFTVTVTVRDQGQPTTTFVNGVPVTITTSPSAPVTSTAATITVADAPLDAHGATVAAVEGQSLTNVLVATFVDTGGAEAIGNYTATINWGDGTTTPGTVSITPGGTSPAGTTFEVRGSRPGFANPGTFPLTVTIRSAGGSAAVATGEATVTDAPLTVTCLPLTVDERAGDVNLTVATFTDAGGPEAVGRYSALINWGDGSPPTLGTITFNPATQTFSVSGTHDFDEAGTFPVTVQVTSADGSTASATCPITVTGLPINLTGQLDPSSDSGISATDRITNVRTLTFFGTAQEEALVQLFAQLPGQAGRTLVGRTRTDEAGNWRITTPPLPDGAIAFTVTASDPGEVMTETVSLGTVTLDTVGPQVTSVQLDRARGRVVIGFQDGLAGLDGRSLIDGSNYAFTRARARLGQFLITSLTASPTAGPTSTVIATINRGLRLRGGFSTLLVRSGGIQDVAGNALDGEFFGLFPSGNGNRGGDFVARLDSIHNVIFAPAPVGGTASPLTSPGSPGSAVLIPTVVEGRAGQLRRAQAARRAAAIDLVLGQEDVRRNHARAKRPTQSS